MSAQGMTRWLITIAVMLVAVIEVLDMTIVNVALEPMMGALGATRDQITWVLTSYIISAAIVMPLTGFLVDRLGRKKLLLINIIGFMITSALCGVAQSLMQIVFFRVLQGVFGAALIPLSQYIMIDTFSKEERGMAMAIWGIGIMVGPILGPTLGGYITDTLNWRWIFFINIPVCVIAFFMSLQFVKETVTKAREVDWLGLTLMILGVGCLQFVLDRGQTADWFESYSIIFSAIICVIALTTFIVRGKSYAKNIIKLQLFKDYNFTICCIVLVMFCMGLFSIVAMQPIMMQQLMDYPAKIAGLVMAPRGLTSAIAMLVVSRTITRFDPRFFVITGLFILAITAYWMSHFNLTTSYAVMSSVSLLQGFGVGFFFVPLSTLAFVTLPAELQAEGAGLFNFARNLGTSLGISMVSTFVARSTQTNWNYVVSQLHVNKPSLQQFLTEHHWTLARPDALAYFLKQINLQSSMVAFVNAYWMIAVCFLLGLPLMFLLKRPKEVKLVIGE